MMYSTDLVNVLRGQFLILISMNILFTFVSTNEVELRRSLFHKRPYDQKVCPEKGITKVHTNLILLQIESVSEREQVVTSNIQLRCAWCDPYMSWNLSRFNITELSVSANSLWTPDVVLVNSADRKYSRNREHYAVILRHDGYVRFMFQDLWKTICKVRSTYFPFDLQRCTITIRSSSRDSQSIKFLQRRPIQGHSFIRGEWELINSYTEISDEPVSNFGLADYSVVHFTLILKRNHVYYTIRILLPFTLVSFVTLFTFLLPPQTGEKLTLSVTILLSLVIYLQLFSAYIPKSDDETPILTLFCNANFFLVFLSCMLTVYVLYLNYHPSTSRIIRVPPLLKKIFLDYLSPCVYCGKDKDREKQKLLKKASERRAPRRLSSIDKRMSHIFSITSSRPRVNQEAFELLQCLKQLKTHIRSQWLGLLSTNDDCEIENDLLENDNQQNLDDWQHIALILDRLFFILFIIAMPCTTLLLLSARLSNTNDLLSNITTIKLQSLDAKCDLIYKPMLT